METTLAQLTVGQLAQLLGTYSGMMLVFAVLAYIVANLLLDIIYYIGEIVAYLVKKLFSVKNEATELDLRHDK